MRPTAGREGVVRRAGRRLARRLAGVGRRVEDAFRASRVGPGLAGGPGCAADLRRLRAAMGRFAGVVVWGLRRTEHTHRYIHRDYVYMLRRAGVSVRWVEDDPESRHALEPDTLVLAVDVAGRHLPARPDVYYCLHNFDGTMGEPFEELPPARLVHLQVYTRSVDDSEAERWRPFVAFDRRSRTLFQPWGADLLPAEFRPPVFVPRSRRVFWVGSIWDDEEGRGNRTELVELREVLRERGLALWHVERAPSFLNVALVRRSRIAPAIAGRWQVENHYLPCRLFKNVAYGQLGLTNVPAFRRILGDAFVEGEGVAELVDRALGLSRRRYLELVREQQARIGVYNHAEGLCNVARAFDVVAAA